MSIIVCAADPKVWKEFIRTLASGGFEVRTAETGNQALDMVRAKAPRLVVVDRELPDFKPLALVGELLKVNAMVNTAVVSSMPENEFHEASEGLGVLARLQPEPGPDEASRLLGLLAGLPPFP